MNDDVLPIWAEKFNFAWHSPSAATRPHGMEFFEKVIARPRKIYSPPGCTMKAGTAAHRLADDVIVDGMSQGEALRAAVALFDEHELLAHYPDDAAKFDIIKHETYTDDGGQEDTIFNLTLEHLVAGAREATTGENKVEKSQWVSVELDGLKLPYIGQMDLQTRGVVELKTMWPSLSINSKRGWKLQSLPAKPRPDHCRQVALYWKKMRRSSDNVPVHLVYANCKSFRIFSSADTDELSEANLNQALESLQQVASIRENMMARSTSVTELLQLVSPEFDHWMWREKTDEYKNAAEAAWQEASE